MRYPLRQIYGGKSKPFMSALLPLLARPRQQKVGQKGTWAKSLGGFSANYISSLCLPFPLMLFGSPLSLFFCVHALSVPPAEDDSDQQSRCQKKRRRQQDKTHSKV
jgi:hypothetical protein